MKDLVQEFVFGEWVIKFYEAKDRPVTAQLATYNRAYKSGEGDYFTNQIGIEVFEKGRLSSSCLIAADGGGTGITETTALINHEGMVVCCGNTVFKLTLPDLNLVWQTVCDGATCFGIYYFQQGYVVHGELEISRLDKAGNLLWQRGGMDIWTTLKGADDFAVYEHHIVATDWGYNKYKFDADGNLLEADNLGPVSE